MIIYNVTSNVDDSIQDEWMTWMMDSHVPAIMETGKFYKIKIQYHETGRQAPIILLRRSSYKMHLSGLVCESSAESFVPMAIVGLYP